jgi:outer membrane protein OmpA-like peptidoglycan-associated protein
MADSGQAFPIAARDANPVCPDCGEPLLVSTPVVNPRRNAFVAAGVVALLVLVGLGFALKHYFAGSSIASVAVPTTVPASSAAVANNSSGPTSAPSVAAATNSSAKPTSAPNVAAANHSATPARAPSVNRVGLAGGVASPPPQSHTATIPVGAPPVYADLRRTADKLDFTFHFGRGSDSLDDEANVDIGRLTSLLKTEAYRARKVLIAGFADNTGDPGYSKFLSAQRAQTVAAELASQGVSVAKTFGFGQVAPIGDNATRAGREQNRRVEIFVAH